MWCIDVDIVGRMLIFIWLRSAFEAGERESSESRVLWRILSISSVLSMVGSLGPVQDGWVSGVSFA